MALVLANRVQESATANTTVSFTLTGAVAGFQTFAVIGDTNTTYYSATDTTGQWEVGLGTYSTTGPTLTRTTIYASSNTGSAVTFSGVVSVFVTYPSGKSVNLDGSGNVSALGTVASGTWQGSTIGVAYGGTGVTTSSGPNSVVLRDADGNIKGVNNVEVGLTLTTSAGGTTTLTAASTQIQILTGSANQTYKLPDATTLQPGVFYTFANGSTGTLTVTDYADAVIETVAQGGAAQALCISAATVAGTWGFRVFASSNTTWGNAFLDYPGSITSATWTGNTVQPAYGGTGLTTFAGSNNALFSTGASTLTAGTLPILAGGTGQTTANTAFNALAPSQTSNSGKYLTTNGTDTSWATVGGGASITNDTTTATNVYPLFADVITGTPSTIYTSNAKLLYKPSTGDMQSSAVTASNGIFVNSATVTASYTVASGNNASSAGPLLVDSGVTVTVSSGGRWVVI
jgi:hypothetical protein